MPGKTGKRKTYFHRELVKCSICDKPLQKDNFQAHKAKYHPNEPAAQYVVVQDSKQRKLSFCAKKKDDASDPLPDTADPRSESEDNSGKSENISPQPQDEEEASEAQSSVTTDPGEGTSEKLFNFSQEEADQLWKGRISPGISLPGSPSRADLDITIPCSDLELVSGIPGTENNNEFSTKAIASSSTASIIDQENLKNNKEGGDMTNEEQENESNHGRSFQYVFGVKVKPWPAATATSTSSSACNFDQEHNLESNSGKSENIFPEPEKAVSRHEKPHQPLLASYAPYHDGKNKRDFQPEWFKKFPWLEYDEISKSASCFACNKFGKDVKWKFETWKNSNALGRHSGTSSHKDAVTKWVGFLSSRKNNTSVLQQVNTQHVQNVVDNRAYVKCLIETVAYCALQGIAFQGHDENRENLTQLSDTNRGNYLELLSL